MVHLCASVSEAAPGDSLPEGDTFSLLPRQTFTASEQQALLVTCSRIARVSVHSRPSSRSCVCVCWCCLHPPGLVQTCRWDLMKMEGMKAAHSCGLITGGGSSQRKEGLMPVVENGTFWGKGRTVWGWGEADCGAELGCLPPPSVTHRQSCHCQYNQQGRGICLPPQATLICLSARVTILLVCESFLHIIFIISPVWKR